MQTAQHDPMRGRAVGSALVVVTAGILLHYAWDWSGRSPFVSFFAATNESTWEHPHHLALDIATFVVAVFAGEFAGHSPMDRRTAPGVRVLAAAGIVIAVVAFSTYIQSAFVVFVRGSVPEGTAMRKILLVGVLAGFLVVALDVVRPGASLAAMSGHTLWKVVPWIAIIALWAVLLIHHRRAAARGALDE